ncbi:MAG: chemotaxis protein CheB [Candidatus Eremiobacteraeota bacterium]|nr:chemotaxis protein CheB [Candidatus Eremiobacteraeota bacterium]
MIRLLLVENSETDLVLLRHVLTRDQRFEIVGEAGTGPQAVALTERLRPDIVSMDLCLPEFDGAEAVRRIMQTHPTPVVVVTGKLPELNTRAIEALHYGALEVLQKPPPPSDPDHERAVQSLYSKLAVMSRVPVLRRRRTLNGRPEAAGPRTQTHSCEAIGIVASTGGPAVLANIFGKLDPKFDLPILLVQHITPTFEVHFANWLQTQTRLNVCVASHGQTLARGGLYVAPSGHHLTLLGRRLSLSDEPPLGYHRPSGTLLLRSLARALKARAAGVVLTGMGNDGAEGLGELTAAGGLGVVQAPETALVASMPRRALEKAPNARPRSPESIARWLSGLRGAHG